MVNIDEKEPIALCREAAMIFALGYGNLNKINLKNVKKISVTIKLSWNLRQDNVYDITHSNIIYRCENF